LQRWFPLGEHYALTAFEVFTAAALDRFARDEMDLVVLEVGLGGRLDATTAHPDRRVVGFGPIGMDHREFLGDTQAAIAHEKAAVMSPGQIAISGPQSPEVAEVLERQAHFRGCQLRWVHPLPGEEAGGLPLGLPGTFQRSNGAVALGMARSLIEQGWPISEEAIAQGLQQARWPGRLEGRRWQGRSLLLDGAHNPPGAMALRRELDLLEDGGSGPTGVGRRWLLAMQRSKEAPAVLDALLAPADAAAIVSLSDLPSWSVEALLEARPALEGRLQAVANPLEGLRWLRPPGPLPVIAGSLHLLGEIWPLLDPSPQDAGA
jgi:dihydrofolate synthase/folylpolyglutamate synthase